MATKTRTMSVMVPMKMVMTKMMAMEMAIATVMDDQSMIDP